MPCNFSNLSVARTALEFGDVNIDMNVIRINFAETEKYTHAIVNGVRYLIVKTVVYKHDTAFYVQEVANNEYNWIRQT